MSFSKQLKDLKRQRREEVQSLKHAYTRTKREIIRKTSPKRMVRKHLPMGLGAAALLGFLIAPRPSPRYTAPKHAESNGHAGEKSGFLGSLFSKIGSFIPGVGKSEPPPPPPKSHGLLGALMKAAVPLLTMLLKRVDLQKVIHTVMMQVAGKGHPDPGGQEGEPGNGHDGSPPPPDEDGPQFTVANSGTVQTS